MFGSEMAPHFGALHRQHLAEEWSEVYTGKKIARAT